MSEIEALKKQFTLVDQSLFDLAAMLIKYEVVILEDIWPHIENKLVQKDDKDEIEELLEKQNKSLDYLYGFLFKSIMNAEGFEKEMREQMVEPRHIELEQKRAKMHCNFKIRLLQSCIRVNDWATADDIINGIYDGKFDLSWS